MKFTQWIKRNWGEFVHEHALDMIPNVAGIDDAATIDDIQYSDDSITIDYTDTDGESQTVEISLNGGGTPKQNLIHIGSGDDWEYKNFTDLATNGINENAFITGGGADIPDGPFSEGTTHPNFYGYVFRQTPGLGYIYLVEFVADAGLTPRVAFGSFTPDKKIAWQTMTQPVLQSSKPLRLQLPVTADNDTPKALIKSGIDPTIKQLDGFIDVLMQAYDSPNNEPDMTYTNVQVLMADLTIVTNDTGLRRKARLGVLNLTADLINLHYLDMNDKIIYLYSSEDDNELVRLRLFGQGSQLSLMTLDPLQPNHNYRSTY